MSHVSRSTSTAAAWVPDAQVTVSG
jgi:hypothetical protein